MYFLCVSFCFGCFLVLCVLFVCWLFLVTICFFLFCFLAVFLLDFYAMCFPGGAWLAEHFVFSSRVFERVSGP